MEIGDAFKLKQLVEQEYILFICQLHVEHLAAHNMYRFIGQVFENHSAVIGSGEKPGLAAQVHMPL